MSEAIKTCETIGCPAPATHALTYPDIAGGLETKVRDVVCEPCGEEFTRRPAQRATLAQLAEETFEGQTCWATSTVGMRHVTWAGHITACGLPVCEAKPVCDSNPDDIACGPCRATLDGGK